MTISATSLDLRAKRGALWKKAKAIHVRATEANRDLTHAEQAEWDRLNAEMDRLKKQIDRQERADSIDAEMAQSLGRVIREPDTWGPNARNGGSKSPLHLGDGAYLLTPEQSMRDVTCLRGEVEGLRSESETRLSLGRWFRGVVTGNWRGAEDELAEMRAASTGDGASGGYWVPSELSSRVIDLARNRARVFEAGAMTVAMDTNELTLVKVEGDPVASWKGENQPGGETDMEFGFLKLRPRTLYALFKMSVELFEDAYEMGGTIQNALASALGLALDKGALYGVGEPIGLTGLRNWPGVQEYSMGENGAALENYAPFSHAVEKIWSENGEPKAVIYAPRTAGALDRLADLQGQPLKPPASFESLRKLVTNQVPTDMGHGSADNASDAFVGDWRQLIVGMRTDLRIEVSRDASDLASSAFRNLQVWVRAYLRADVGVAQPTHFCVIKGIIPSA